MKRFLLFIFFLIPAAFMPSSLLIAFDFGLVLDQSVGVGGTIQVILTELTERRRRIREG